MPLTILCGPPGCGKSRSIWERYVAACREGGSDSVILLVPEAATAAERREQLVAELGGLFDPRLLTFPQLAETLLKANHDTVHRLEPSQRTLLVQRLARLPQIGFPETLSAMPGFISGLCDLLDELKRAAVSPEQFMEAVRHALPRDARAAALARFYACYQEDLAQRNLYDEPGLFWRATHLLRNGSERPFGKTTLILVDGFTDFTTTQLQVLANLAGQKRELVITVTLAPEEERAQHFASAHRLLQQLREHFGEGEVVWLRECDGRPAALRHVLDHLYRLQPKRLADPAGTLEVIEAPGLLAEVRETLREVKGLLLEGVPPEDIAIIFRSCDEYRRTLQETARELGLPLTVRGGESLSARPCVQVVLDLLQIPLGDYRQADVVKFLKSNFIELRTLQPAQSPVTPEQLEAAAHEARIIAGRESWADQFRLYRQRLDEERRLAERREALLEDEEPRRTPRIEADLRQLEAAAALFDRLVERLALLNRTQPRREHIRRLLELIEQFGIARRLVARPVSLDMAANLTAFHEFLQALRALADTEEHLGEREPIPFSAFAREIVALCADTSFELQPPHEPRVLACELYHARQLRKPHVFLCGLVEGKWPLARHEKPFFDDRERARLRAQGLQLDVSSDLQQEETYLFYLACATAEQRLWLTCHNMDSQGQPLLRSHYLEEVRRLFDTVPERQMRLSEAVVEPAQAVCLREVLEHVVQREDRTLWSRLEPALTAEQRALALQALQGAELEGQRYSRDPFGAYDGVLADPDACLRLQQHFGDDYRWSATQLGEYGHCPFHFFAKRVLQLQTLEPLGEEVEALDLGSLIHSVLWRFLTWHQTQHPDEPLAAAAREVADQKMRELVREAFAQRQNNGLVTHRKLWELACEQTVRDLLDFVRHEFDEVVKTGLVPRAFEVTYEIEAQPEDELSSLWLRGKIDRVDVQPNPPAGEPQQYRVYDYKSRSGPSPRQIEVGLDFQLPFYALGAAEAVLGGQTPRPECTGWAYYGYRTPVALRQQVEREAKRYLGVEEYMALALSWAAEYARRIRGGNFQVAPAECRREYCDFSAICRYARWRAKAKQLGGAE